MIPFASQRGGGQDLATHLQNAHDNELTELVDLRGAVADDLHGAFKEWEAQVQALTRCSKYLYSLSINPDPAQGPLTRTQYMDYIRRSEEALGLCDQPRAIVFHTKYGREHCHVVWSRIDAENGKAVHLAFDRDKLMRVTRGFARDHGLDLPQGYDKSRQIGQLSLYEKEQERQTGLSKADHVQAVTEAWRHSDDPRSFVQALAERGYILATGKRPYVLIDLYGTMHALPKLIDDKSVRTNDIRQFLDKDFPLDSLPSVEEAQRLVAAHRALIEKSVDESRCAAQLAALRHAQGLRRQSLLETLSALKTEHHRLRQVEAFRHRHERDALRDERLQELRSVRQQRFNNRPTGLAAFLAKVTGIALLRKVRERRDDARHMEIYLEHKAGLKVRQAVERASLNMRLKIQTQHAERKLKSLDRIDKREIAALVRDSKALQRVQARAGQGMPPIEKVVEQASDELKPLGLREQFQKASSRRHPDVPKVLVAFMEAAASEPAYAGREEGERNLFNRKASESQLFPQRDIGDGRTH